VGYHFIVVRSGQVFEGRDLMFKGEHIAGANTGKIGIVLTGDYEHQVFDSDHDLSPAQLASVTKLINSLKSRFPTLVNIGGHRDYFTKPPTWTQKNITGLCQGQELYNRLPDIRKDTGLGGP
jgi:N-acetyl-anhydromuramyl-L-alanine amidase AmpD